jgi:enoyl-CoA hydratase/carnithine racemase
MTDVSVRRDGPLATVLLDRPQRRNAMTLAMWREVGAIFTTLATDRSVRGIVLTGAGGNFSVGADITEFEAVRGDAAAAADYERSVDACADAIASSPQPVIAALEGYCLGGGCHMALAADFRFAAPGASIGIPSARLSIVYGVRSTQRLLALVGLTHAKRILFGGERMSGDEAQRIGLLCHVADNPAGAAAEALSRIALNAPLSIGGAKAILTGLTMAPGALDLDTAERLIDAAADSADYEEGRRAFAERRAPLFKGE